MCPILPTSALSNVSADNISNLDFEAYPPMQEWLDGYSDVKFMQGVIRELADDSKNILLAVHSYGARSTESATSELRFSARAKEGRSGNVVGNFYFSDYILLTGQSIHSFFCPEGDAKGAQQ